jgi:serine/threonine-protein kinase
MEELSGDLQNRFPDAKALARELVDRDWLTAYQLDQVARGRAAALLLGQYVILDKIGEGGMGEVYKARHRNMGRIVALKVLKKERLVKPDAVRRFRREMQAAGLLTHPNIVMAYDADSVGDHHFFAMEYVDGIDLLNLVTRKGPLSVSRAADYIRQAALGLQHVHEQAMVHRDIKPSNLLVTRDGSTVKILDVGLARIGDPDDPEFSALTQPGKVVGTVDYMAPEQARNSHRADLRSDIYSLGCTLYFIVSGNFPFPGGGTVVERLMRRMKDEPVPVKTVVPQVPEEFAAVVHKMFRRDPEERYQTATEVAAALEPFRKTTRDDVTITQPIDGSTASLPSVSVANVPSKPAPPKGNNSWQQAGLVTAAVLIGVLAGIIGMMLFSPRTPETPKKTDSAPPPHGRASEERRR